ncbi:MAG TPA: hypothetical protein VGF63_00225 [Solirubrobacteraceae bacterium]|jgi:hypothetical protein
MHHTAPSETPAVDGLTDAVSTPPRNTRIRAIPTIAAAPDADAAAASAGRIRLCILCGRPVRAGQHILRVHGSTIHARCSVSGR